MAIQIESKEEGMLILRISGMATAHDMEQWEGAAVGAIKLFGKTSAMVVLDDFKGWEKSEKWNDINFVAQHGEDIEKVAFVGDPKWKDEVFAFTGKPFRKTLIEFFNSENDAKAWLEEN